MEVRHELSFCAENGDETASPKTQEGNMVYRQMVGSDHVKTNYGDLVRRSDIVEIWIDERQNRNSGI